MNERDMVHNYGPSGYVSPRSVEEKMRQMADANDGKVALANRVHELEAEVSRLTAELAARTEDVATLKSTLLSDEEQMRTLQKRIDSQRDLTIAAGLDAGKYLVRAETVEAELAAAKAERDGLAAALDHSNKAWIDAAESVRVEMKQGAFFQNPALAIAARAASETLNDKDPAAILARVKAEGRKSLAEDFRAANPNELFFNLELARLAAQPEGSESK